MGSHPRDIMRARNTHTSCEKSRAKRTGRERKTTLRLNSDHPSWTSAESFLSRAKRERKKRDDATSPSLFYTRRPLVYTRCVFRGKERRDKLYRKDWPRFVTAGGRVDWDAWPRVEVLHKSRNELSLSRRPSDFCGKRVGERFLLLRVAFSAGRWEDH